MARLSSGAILRICVLIFLGLVVLEYVWVKTRGGVPWGRGEFLAGCPAPAELSPVGTASYDWELETLDGEAITLEQFRGQAIFINLWATWCGPCREEMPSIQSLYENFGEEVAFVIVSEEEAEEIREFVEKKGYTFPSYVSTGRVPAVFESNAIPATYIVNSQGQVVLKKIGSNDWNHSSCHTFLKALTNTSGQGTDDTSRAPALLPQ